MTCPACGQSRPHHLFSCRRGRDAMWTLVKLNKTAAQRWAREYLDWTRS